MTTTLLSGRQMQPAQAWLPMSIPQTYLMGASSSEDVDAVVLIAHLPFLAFTIAVHHTRCKAAPRSARNPTKEARASAHAGSAIWLIRPPCEQPLAVATSLIDPFDPGGRGAVSVRRSLLLHRPQTATQALPLLPSVYPLRRDASTLLFSKYYMKYYMNGSQPLLNPGHG